MATVPLATLLPETTVFAPGCSEIIMSTAILNTAIDFCDKTLLWWETTQNINCPANQGSVPVPAPTQLTTWNNAAVLEVYINNFPVPPVSSLGLTSSNPNWMSQVSSNPVAYLCNGNTIQLVPTNSVAVSVSTRVAYKPSRAAVAIPDWLYEDHWETLKAGALSRVLGVPSQAWTNENLSEIFHEIYTSAVRKAKIKGYKNRTVANMRVQYQGVA